MNVFKQEILYGTSVTNTNNKQTITIQNSLILYVRQCT